MKTFVPFIYKWKCAQMTYKKHESNRIKTLNSFLLSCLYQILILTFAFTQTVSYSIPKGLLNVSACVYIKSVGLYQLLHIQWVYSPLNALSATYLRHVTLNINHTVESDWCPNRTFEDKKASIFQAGNSNGIWQMQHKHLLRQFDLIVGTYKVH